MRPAPAPTTAETSGNYHAELTDLVLGLWRRVIARRAPEVADRLDDPLPTDRSAIPYLQALNIRFQLQRIVDENAAVRDRRHAETEGGAEAVPESFAALARCHGAPGVLAAMAAETSVGPTLTAHPTETKRVTVLEIHRRIYRLLVKLETDRWTPREREALLDEIEDEIDLLWMTGELRIDRPTPRNEITWGLHFFRDIVFDAVPQVFDSLARAGGGGPVPRLRFHSWIGGDRDGNPNVTTDVTRAALREGRATILSHYDAMLSEAAARLSISDRITMLAVDHRDALRRIVGDDVRMARNPNEVFRQALSAIRDRLADGYAHVSAFIDDLQRVEAALRSLSAGRHADRHIRPIRYLAEVFGFRTVTLDIRQNSTVTTNTIREIWSLGGKAPSYGTQDWSTRLRAELSSDNLTPPDTARLTESARELLDLLKLMSEVETSADPRAIGPFILSMTRSADDLLGVLLLARYAGFHPETPEITVVPLFETISDLRAAPGILQDLLDVPVARRSVTRHSRTVEIMLGYSDSNKDGGFICSSWEVHHAQSRITVALAQHGLKASFFHGRGGSVSRGGAPTHRAIAAQPPGTIGTAIRLTEQGEVVSARYANRGTAAAHLELLMSSAYDHRLSKPTRLVVPEHDDALEALAGLSQVAYTKLLNTPGFLDYFQEASPVEELASLKIGSRPAKRFGAATLDDLRAIPWVFAWSQNRHLITGWYGFGSAVETFLSVRGLQGRRILRDMFQRSDLFRLIMDEIEKTLYQTDLGIAADYAGLVRDADTGVRFRKAIANEFDRSVKAAALIGESDRLADRFEGFRARFDQSRADLDRIHHLQIALLRSARDEGAPSRVSIPLMQTMNCISSGLGWTG